MSIPEFAADDYHKGIEQGHTVATVKAMDASDDTARAITDRYNAFDFSRRDAAHATRAAIT